MAVASRYLTHAVVLCLLVLVPSITAISRFTPLTGLIASPIAAGAAFEPQIGNVSLGPQDSVVNSISLPVTAAPAGKPYLYTVAQGDTVFTLAAKFGLSIQTLAWANGFTSATIAQLHVGQQIWIPPTDGVLYTTNSGDTVASVAAKFGVPLTTVLAYNQLASPGLLSPGTKLMLPGASETPVNWLPPPPPPAPTPAPAQPAPQTYSGGTISGGSTYSGGGGWPNHFYFGNCTWYVANIVYIPWFGNANQWFANARPYGYAEGYTPRVNSIMVTDESYYGHVAWVTAVYPDGSWQVTEMNYIGFDEVDSRHIYPGQVPLIGFIYY